MDSQRYQRISQVFLSARDLPVVQRRAVLDEACASDPDLRSEVESLLQHHERPAEGFQTPLLADHASWIDALEREAQRAAATPTPERIGRYRILSVLGEGGMGVVYRAEQDNPRRVVAI